ncbi:MAG: tRNA pseudouridine(38-40) synthase TruA [Gammaproteobacteria bacterium]|nr:MAG: tRNA pseudouridine(38-40) synthase TruA [Gammaproteobacteria bacterium]
MAVAQDWQYRVNYLVPEGRKLPSGIFRYAAAIEYDGSDYCGWQRQRHCTGVQEVVEKALSAVADEPVKVACAGRTDTGVHATAQIIHFDSRAMRSSRNWMLGSNANMPRNVRCHWAEKMPDNFHARFSAHSRTYRYLVLNTSSRPALLRQGLAWEGANISLPAMNEAVAALIGEHDFSSFRGAGCQSATPWRSIHYIDIFRLNDIVVFEIRANAFLLHMVRNIMGALLAVGRGEHSPQWLGQLLALRDRSKAGVTAPAQGLYLVRVAYPSEFAIPVFKPGPCFVGRDLYDVIHPSRPGGFSTKN